MSVPKVFYGAFRLPMECRASPPGGTGETLVTTLLRHSTSNAPETPISSAEPRQSSPSPDKDYDTDRTRSDTWDWQQTPREQFRLPLFARATWLLPTPRRSV